MVLTEAKIGVLRYHFYHHSRQLMLEHVKFALDPALNLAGQVQGEKKVNRRKLDVI